MSSKENEKLTTKGTLTLKSGQDLKAHMMRKMLGENQKTNLITRTGNSSYVKEEKTLGLSQEERRKRMKALETVSTAQQNETEHKKQKEAKARSIEEIAINEPLIPLQAKVKSESDMQSFSYESLNKTLEIEPKIKKTVVKKAEPEAPIIAFKQGENIPSIDEIIKTEPQIKVDRRDKSLIDKMMQHYKYLEFDSDAEIETLQKGIELRNALEEKRKTSSSGSSDEDVPILISSNDSDEEVIKVRREAYFSRHNRKPLKKRFKSSDFTPKEIEIYDKNLVLDIARGLAIKVEHFIKKLRSFGIVAKETDIIDGDAAELAIEEMGHVVKRVKKLTAEDKINKLINGENLTQVVPVVTIMGHVDHGKTSLLDVLRNKNVADGEAGGITQHIGAYQTVLENGRKITFIDTPGHAAFTAIRARGANVTHVIVLVVAADDGVMPQTVEAINHAKAAGVPIVVAINKIDKPGADIQKVKNELLVHELVSEDLGGDIIFVPVSAKLKQNLDKLCDAILLQSEILDAKAEFNALASGVVLEGKMDKQKGIIATLLVQNGTLKTGDVVVIESSYFKVRTMVDDAGENVLFAEPSMPIQAYGLSEVPTPGASFNVVENEKIAREITSHRKDKKVEMEQKADVRGAFAGFLKPKDDKKPLNLIIRADVQSTIEAIKYSLNGIKLPSEVEIKIMQASVGPVTEADVTFAKTYNAVIFAFSVKVGTKEEELAKKNNVILKQHAIIYKIVDDVKEMLSAKLSPIVKDETIGEAEVRIIFDISKSGKIAGCMVKKGMVKRNAIVKVFRKDVVITEGKIKTLKHFKDDVKELSTGNECGIQIEGFENFLAGDVLQIIERTEEKRIIE